jgi:prevent-host-death family protein
MESMAISKFKATCLAAIERVRTTGEPLLITKRGEPVAQLVPPPGAQRRRGDFEPMDFEILGDIVSPTGVEEDIEALK